MESPPQLTPMVRRRPPTAWCRHHGAFLLSAALAFSLAFNLIGAIWFMHESGRTTVSTSRAPMVLRAADPADRPLPGDASQPAWYVQTYWSGLTVWFFLPILPPVPVAACFIEKPALPRFLSGPPDERRPFAAIRRSFWFR